MKEAPNPYGFGAFFKGLSEVSCWLILYHKISGKSIEKKQRVLYTMVRTLVMTGPALRGRYCKNGGQYAGNQESDKGVQGREKGCF